MKSDDGMTFLKHQSNIVDKTKTFKTFRPK